MGARWWCMGPMWWCRGAKDMYALYKLFIDYYLKYTESSIYSPNRISSCRASLHTWLNSNSLRNLIHFKSY